MALAGRYGSHAIHVPEGAPSPGAPFRTAEEQREHALAALRADAAERAAMGEIRRRERSGRVSYLARHYGPEGRKVSKAFDRRKDAADWLTTVENPKLTGNYIDPTRSKITVASWAERWISSNVNLAPKTRDRYEGNIHAHIEPAGARCHWPR